MQSRRSVTARPGYVRGVGAGGRAERGARGETGNNARDGEHGEPVLQGLSGKSDQFGQRGKEKPAKEYSHSGGLTCRNVQTIFASHLEQSKIFFPCHPCGFHIIQDNCHRYLIIPWNHDCPFCRWMMEDHMITTLADERAPGHLKYPDLRFPISRGYLFQIASLKRAK